jgi:hypothetical protein
MKRRHFLSAAAFSLGSLAWPDWLRQAFADPACGDDRYLAAVSGGFRRAHLAGKPLLCLVIPKDDTARYERGHAFGEVLNHGSDEDLAPLALCEVVCAPMAALRRIVPAAGEGEPLMVLVDTAATPATGVRLSAELPKDEPFDRFAVGNDEKDWRKAMEEGQRREEAAIARRIDTLGRLLRTGITGASLQQRVAQARAALPKELLDRVERDIAKGGPPVPELVHPAAALWAQAALAARGKRRAEVVHALAEAVRGRLVQAPIPGSRWARASGCGLDIEGETGVALVACGMGHVPEKSQRFLYFFATRAERKQCRKPGDPKAGGPSDFE